METLVKVAVVVAVVVWEQVARPMLTDVPMVIETEPTWVQVEPLADL